MKFLKGIIIAAKVIGALAIIAMGLFVLFICFILLSYLWTEYGPLVAIIAAIYMISSVAFADSLTKKKS